MMLNTDSKITASQISNFLKSLEKPSSYPSENGKRGKHLPNWKEIEAENCELKAVVISELFGHRDCNVLFNSLFTVYANSESEVQEIKKIANSYGYKNINTYIPLAEVEHDDSASTLDPNHAFAVDIKESTSMIYGKFAERWLAIHKEIIDPVREDIIFTQCHNSDARLIFADKNIAVIFNEAFNSFYNTVKEECISRGKNLPPVVSKLTQKNLDNWVVSFNYAELAAY